MGLFSKIFGTAPKMPMTGGGYFDTFTAYTPAFTSWSGQLYESELVRSAIDARARHISKLKVEIIGTAKPSLRTKLAAGPNEFQTWGQFLYRLSTILDMQNSAFIVPVFGPYGELTGVYPILPSRAELVQTASGTAWIKYTFGNGTTGACKLSETGIMTRFQYRDDFFGEDNKALFSTMDLIEIQRQGITEAVKNSSTYRFMARINNFAKAEDLAKERQRFNKENFASENGGGLLLFPNTYADIKQIENKPVTIDADQQKLIQTNVYNYYGVNEKILQNSAYGDEWSAFYEGAVESFSIQFSDVMTRMLFTQRERAAGAEVIATANRLQYMSNADKLNVSAQMADRGIMSINEIREIWNLPPIEGGDVYIMRGEYKNSNDVSEDSSIEENTDGEN